MTPQQDHSSLSAWDRVQLARHPQRPRTLDYVRTLCEDFVELHGDRRFGDDQALVGGVASLLGRTLVVLGHQKGTDTRENLRRNFGMPRPEGYRKALRLFAHAEKFQLPVLCLIDTPGAAPDKESEERGQANAIAECIMALAGLKTPVVACVIGEGGSGGALAIGVADQILMLENSVYSVASPEAAASILWRDSAKAPEAARAMRIGAPDLYALGIVDQVIPEPPGGAHLDAPTAIASVGMVLRDAFEDLTERSISQLLNQRYEKYRAIGRFQEREGALFAAANGEALPFS